MCGWLYELRADGLSDPRHVSETAARDLFFLTHRAADACVCRPLDCRGLFRILPQHRAAAVDGKDRPVDETRLVGQQVGDR
jgi:hypothetical protein